MNPDQAQRRDVHRHLTDAAHEWGLLERDAAALYRGAHLAQARDWANANPDALNAQERAFLEASEENEKREAREREEQQERELNAARELAETQSRSAKQLRRRAVFLAGALLVALVLAGLAVFLSSQARQSAVTAQEHARTATARELAAAANNSLDVDPERSILLAMQAVTTTYSINQTTTKEAEEALHRAIQNSRRRLTLHPNTGNNGSVAFSPDGKRLATGGENGQVKLWDVISGQELFSIPAHEKAIWGVTFSPAGTRLATGGDDGTVKLWDLQSQQTFVTLNAHEGGITNIAFSRDGKRLATAGNDKTAKIWDEATGKLLHTLTGHTDVVFSAKFSPDGTRLATAGNDKQVKIWDITSGKELQSLTDFDVTVNSVAFSPDGLRLVTSSFDGTAKVWDLTTGKEEFTLSGHSATIWGLVYSADANSSQRAARMVQRGFGMLTVESSCSH